MQNDQVHWLERATRRMCNAAMFLSDVCMAAMITLVSLNCLLRYLAGAPLYWGDEVMIYLMILMSYLAFGYILIEGRHIRMTALTGRLSPKAQNWTWVFTSLVACVYCGFLVVGSIWMIRDAFLTDFISTTTGDPVWPWMSGVVIGLAVTFLAAILFAGNRIRIARGIKAEARVEKEEILLEM
jgi:TRAP-type C4-dicarboxylate transport system permease small subunit